MCLHGLLPPMRFKCKYVLYYMFLLANLVILCSAAALTTEVLLDLTLRNFNSLIDEKGLLKFLFTIRMRLIARIRTEKLWKHSDSYLGSTPCRLSHSCQ